MRNLLEQRDEILEELAENEAKKNEILDRLEEVNRVIQRQRREQREFERMVL